MKVRRLIPMFLLAGVFFSQVSHAQWAPVRDHILTPWGEALTPDNVWAEYPRPIMERSTWQNLNGLWQYAITAKEAPQPAEWEGDILVPFCVESALSGVAKHPTENDAVWYTRSFTVPSSWKGKQVMLNFGAVDWQADVWVNGIKVGSHTGGYTAFSFNITPALNAKGTQTLTVRAWDPNDHSYIPRGKQMLNPEGIWYTAVTGIWQTVWMEPVADFHLTDLVVTPDIDARTLTVKPVFEGCAKGKVIEVAVKDGGKTVASAKSICADPIVLDMSADMKLWSPDDPFLYDLTVTVKENGKTLDAVQSYAAMRKIGTVRDASGLMRLTLNNEILFQYGPLDQGWWPDGLYTAPSDEALAFDIQKTKEHGFNMIRKHVKVEPARWYTWCDRLGVIVWQDMPSGDYVKNWQPNDWFTGDESERTPESEACYRKEWNEIMEQHLSYPSICVWVPFNEGWGQFKTVEIVNWTKEKDPSRLVNCASGGNHFDCGDIHDLHNYPDPKTKLFDGAHVNVIGEYGGMSLVVKDHLWDASRGWGYQELKSSDAITDEYVKYATMLIDAIRIQYSAAVYTQTTDCESELNGLMTYDRKVMKFDVARIREMNQKVIRSLK